MTKLGLLVFPVPGHLNPSTSLCRSLRDRDHDVIVFTLPDGFPYVINSGLKYHFYAEHRYKKGELKRRMEAAGELSGFAQMRWASKSIADSTQHVVDEIPGLIKELGIDLMIVDEFQPGAGSACQHAGVPYVTISNALTAAPDPAVPPFFMPGGPARNFLGRLKNRFLYGVVELLFFGKAFTIVRKARRRWGLEPLSSVWNECSQQLHLSQEPQELALPRHRPKKNTHFLGPFHDTRRDPPAPFPWDRINGKPLIYASMGTLQNRLRNVFRTIAAACADKDAQLVISLGGGGLEPETLGVLPGDPIVVGFAPQLELLDRATACITHAGMNTAMECLARGVPMIALPVAADQPAVASRIERCGAGISLKTPSPKLKALSKAVHRILTEPSWGENARKMAKCINPSASREKACVLIEKLLEHRIQCGKDRQST